MGIKKDINCSIKDIPFKTSLSFELLVNEIEEMRQNPSKPLQVMAESLMDEINQFPELKQAHCPESALQKCHKVIRQMMAVVINPLNESTEISGAMSPFHMTRFYTTRLYDEKISGPTKRMEIAIESDQDMELVSKIYHAYLLIFDKVYGYKMDVDIPFTFRLIDDQDGSISYYRKTFTTKYLKVKEQKKAPRLSHDDITALINNSEDLNFWHSTLPLDHFEFSGFLAFTYYNITRDYVISQLKSDLLDKKNVESQEGFNKIKRRMRALFENPQLKFGMAVSPDMDATLNNDLVWNTIIPRSELKCLDYMGTLYEKAFREQRIVLTHDMNDIGKDKVVKAFEAKGIRSHAVVPLVIDGQAVGMLEFACVHPNGITLMQMKQLHDVFPTFALALQRSKEEWNTQIQAIIQQKFTAIHPTVEWKFREAVAKILSDQQNDSLGVDDIIFPDVVPIYGASDIRSSSVERNKAIQDDLTEQLQHAYKILKQAKEIKEMPLLDDVAFKIVAYISTVKSGLKAGDEVLILEFLKRDVDPLLRLLKMRYTQMKEPVQKYFDTLDPELHVLYKKRKDFEDSLTLINDKVGEIIDNEQVKAQDVFPHYFEKYRTDGVEYNAYIGQSLVRDLEYDDIYLRNIRLWQLLVKVQVARKVRALQPEMPTKLDISQLILVHSSPLSIAFRQDEKKFDVAGAYNIRYEITKKRIDKALINGTNERVTAVGKIAIIYSHADEIREYKKYIDYMVAQRFLKPTVEELELEDLKGASGLRALRVEVDFSDLTPNVIDTTEIDHVINTN